MNHARRGEAHSTRRLKRALTGGGSAAEPLTDVGRVDGVPGVGVLADLADEALRGVAVRDGVDGEDIAADVVPRRVEAGDAVVVPDADDALVVLGFLGSARALGAVSCAWNHCAAIIDFAERLIRTRCC